MDVTERVAGQRVLIIEDHPIVRRGLEHLIGEETGFIICGMIENAQNTLKEIETLKPDVVLTDIVLEDVNGLDLIKQIRGCYPDLPILVFSLQDELIYAERAMRAGARGYIRKQDPEISVVQALRHVLNGGIWVSDEVTERVLQHMAGLSGPDSSPIEHLSDRELGVFRLIGQGYTSRQIAEIFQFNATTVESYRARIKAKLNLKSGTDLMRYAIEWVRDSGTG